MAFLAQTGMGDVMAAYLLRMLVIQQALNGMVAPT